ncbi:MAG: nitrous oxide reductase accessory protein NosL [Ferruginibacter sp.]|nr:nitrous oxide reductase accessory protein NosL [Ferruginibacter sp.]
MKSSRIQGWIRIMLILCATALIAVLFLPMWRIDLEAPQYPEGLTLLIYPNKLGGNVDIINGLNHYIGMKTMHTEDFIEFTLLPYIIGFFALAFILVAVIAKRKWMNVLFILFVAFGILAMYDFWKWEYNYGHNLNPDAAIIVPGMAYQPPLIGFKQLLNFGAYSLPHIGGWIFISVGALLFLSVVLEWRKSKMKINATKLALLFAISITISSCNAAPEPIKIGVENCHFCKMTISDEKFGAELITKKGRIYKFDDAICIVNYLKTKDVEQSNIKNIYFTNFIDNHQLINVDNVSFFKSDNLRSPMNGNIAAFDNIDGLKKVQQSMQGNIITWEQLVKP